MRTRSKCNNRISEKRNRQIYNRSQHAQQQQTSPRWRIPTRTRTIFLTKECDERSKEVRSQLAEEYEENTPHVGSTNQNHDGAMKEKVVSTLIREADAQNQEEEHAKCKTPEFWNWIDLEAIFTFHEGVRAGTLKCATWHNHHGCRNEKINDGLVGKRCPRCNEIETWEHVMLCEGI